MIPAAGRSIPNAQLLKILGKVMVVGQRSTVDGMAFFIYF